MPCREAVIRRSIMSSEVQLTESATSQDDFCNAVESGPDLTSSDKQTEHGDSVTSLSDDQLVMEAVADTTAVSEEMPTVEDSFVENSSQCKTNGEEKRPTYEKADSDISDECTRVVTTKARGARSYQESRRSKKTAGEKPKSLSGNSKCERTREFVDDARCIEQKGKGDVRDARIQDDDSLRHVKDSLNHPTCDGDQPALVNVIIDERDMQKR